MMPNASENKKASVVWAVAFILFFLLLLAAILFPFLHEGAADLLTGGILLIYGVIILAAIAGIIVALRQRLKELKDGEIDEARKY